MTAQRVLRPVNPGLVGGKGLGKNPIAQRGAPISLTAQVRDVVAGSTRVFDTAALQPGYRVPYLIDEIRFDLDSEFTQFFFDYYPLAPNVQFIFTIGQHQFSQVPVPMSLYGPEYSENGSIENGDDNDAVQIADFFERRRWLLPKPLWLGPGDVIQCSVVRPLTGIAIIDNANVNVATITYVGRTIPPGTPPPPVRNVPWVAWYQHPSEKTYSESNDQFRNKFLKPWHIHRTVAAIVGQNVGRSYDQYMFERATQRYATIKLADSLGYEITRDFVPMADLYAAKYGDAWTFRRSIGPREQLNVAFNTFDPASSGALSPMVSFVGYREELP
jgi:hypothetical protein